MFANKIIVITGAASGFGKLLADALSQDGAKLILGDINMDALDAVAASLPGDVQFQYCDVSKENDQRALVELAVESFGKLDIAINNAGIATAMKSVIDTTEKELDVSFDVNAKGVFFGMKHQIISMLESGEGSILNVASAAGVNGAPKLTAYVAAKHAVVGMTKTAAVEFARKNIRVNAICPFYSPTPMITAGGDADKQEFLATASPMKRLGEPSEIVAAMLSILNPANSYMTGQAVSVDGGVSAT